ncbi:protein of unknown function [Taphrina deformans PYCC 5710]|uniref:PX domain-containing protein n=1 Tax=Taphrina deformans (strain PYCC 5710 / ATCC 11124 / CBS 356.35 / IMI 108563 / JCM 9778 / NBRC 8474) TaxID=1097556 RepID=R4XKC4_TAPDE|nr:protein of unknown function [Taphrina deformans PYCC 5710]|eukprot:CCG83769.1 protein of unknown function [Taphrina deformans PYCC 5710]
MSGFESPYEADNPFADMPGNGKLDEPTKPAPHTTSASESQHANEGEETSSSMSPAVIESSKQSFASAGTEDKPTQRTASRKSGGTKGRKPIRASAISSRLENLDLENDPLGPLSMHDTSETLPVLPSKRSPGNFDNDPEYTQQPQSLSHADNKPRSNISSTAEPSRNPSIPLAQAANPTFSISVGDPTKIGDITSAHTVYKVYTKTNSQAFKNPEFSVTRRYRDFLWLYDQLNRNCPGVIVPPAPDKQAVGRFSEDFIEARRYALERMLEKVAKHPILRSDIDFKLFLESETFAADIKTRPVDQKVAHESHKGFLGLGGAFSMSGKFIETDEFFDQQKLNFDALDRQLKQLSKAVDVVIRQRKDLAHTTAEFGAALSALSTVELSRSLCNALGSLSDLQDKIKELHERQAQQDLLTLGHTVEEYIRLITSVKSAFSARQKAWLAWQSADTETAKRKSTGDKIRRQARTQQDRLNMVDQEMTESERRSHNSKLEFENVGKLLRSEIKRFDVDKVEDFRTSVEVFLESAVESQKEIIEHWEFYAGILAKELDDEDHENEIPSSRGVTTDPDDSVVVSDDSRLNTATTKESQDSILEQTVIEPITPTTPINASGSTNGSEQSPATAIFPPEEANPFARESL